LRVVEMREAAERIVLMVLIEVREAAEKIRGILMSMSRHYPGKILLVLRLV
jgi:hypothetical protein